MMHAGLRGGHMVGIIIYTLCRVSNIRLLFYHSLAKQKKNTCYICFVFEKFIGMKKITYKHGCLHGHPWKRNKQTTKQQE